MPSRDPLRDFVLTAVDLDALIFADTDKLLLLFNHCGANTVPRRIVPAAELQTHKDGIQAVPALLDQLGVNPAKLTPAQGRACAFIWWLADWESRLDYPFGFLRPTAPTWSG